MGPARAAVLSYNFEGPLQATEIAQNANFALFDPSLGTLTGATLQLRGTAAFSFSGTNTSSQSQRANIVSSADLAFFSTLTSLNSLVLSSVIMLNAESGFESYNVGQTRQFGPFTRSGSLDIDLSSILGSLSAFGGGNLGISCDSASGLGVMGGGGSIALTQSSQASCGATIAYTCQSSTPASIPEPGTLALLALGLAALGFASRMRPA